MPLEVGFLITRGSSVPQDQPHATSYAYEQQDIEKNKIK